MFFNINGYNLTTLNSPDTVILCEEPLGFMVSLKSGNKTFAKVVNIPGALYGDDSPFKYMIFVPRDKYKELTIALSETAIWRDKEKLTEDQKLISKSDVTLSEVLDDVKKDIDTSFMKIEPYSFQKLAISWATNKKGKHKIPGGVLADLMGLGKTLEGMGTALKLKDIGSIKNCLIICPATLKLQWQQEIEKFSHEDSIIIESNNNAFKGRAKLYDRVKKESPFFTIINFELLIQREVIEKKKVRGKTKSGKQRTKNVYGGFLDVEKIKDIGYDMILIDEAHNMKNPDTLIAQAIRQIDAEYKLLMTGTPIEKELKNVFQLFDYIHPKILIDDDIDSFDERRKKFEEQFLLTRMNPFVKWTNEIQYFGNKNAEFLRRKINPFMLRRHPEDVSDEMPTETISNITLGFEKTQKRLFDRATDLIKQTNEDLENVAKNEDEKIEKLDNRLKALNTMKTVICSVPRVLQSSHSPITKELIGNTKAIPKTQKEERFLDMISEICIENNEKVVVFTQYARVANYLNDRVTELFEAHAKREKTKRFNNYLYEGATPKGCKLRVLLENEKKDASKAACFGCQFFDDCNTRTKFAWLFQNDPNTKVIIATDAGNSGVNLQSGKHLINYDIPSFFSTYLQRNGRIRRLGSKHENIFIYNLLTEGGSDESTFKTLQKQMETNDLMIENRVEDQASIEKANEFLNNDKKNS